MIRKDEWAKRQAQWARFRNWETRQRVSSRDPGACLADIGALVDLALRQASSRKLMREERASIQGSVVMRQRLAVLGRSG